MHTYEHINMYIYTYIYRYNYIFIYIRICTYEHINTYTRHNLPAKVSGERLAILKGNI